eukprot:8275747-Prorocentrum_lima.AAC.1
MTSSLVGSEMCIRDSYLDCLPLLARRPLRPAGASSSLICRTEPGYDTVSYTHLTLPTICSV